MTNFIEFTRGIFNIVSEFLISEPVVYFVGLSIILVIGLIIKKLFIKGGI